MQGRRKLPSMRVSGGDDGRKGKKPLNRKPLNSNGNYIAQRGAGGGGGWADTQSQVQKQQDALEAQLGFPLFTEGEDKLGWLLNMTAVAYEDKDKGVTASAVDCYFMCQDGSMFKARMHFSPYFYLQVKDGQERDVDGWLRRKFEGRIKDVEVVEREDLDLKNHLSGLQRRLLKVAFWNTQHLQEVKREIAPIVAKNRGRTAAADAYAELAGGDGSGSSLKDVLDSIMDMREHDVPYHVRYMIDTDVRCGHWFTVTSRDGKVGMSRRPDLLQRAEPVICAFDIETTKLPLQFPNAEYDQVYMISYMLDKQGYLIVNRAVVGGDVDDFEYTPKPEFEGPFTVINVPDEASLLKAWFDHMRQVKPAVYVTYNGDFFDFPFIATRAAVHGMDMQQQIGFKMRTASGAGGTTSNECISRCAVHMDCMHWVNRDSYLPQGSRGLKAVTKAKLGYDPVEVSPEEMLPLARSDPKAMASYSVSDAVATYYLYMTYIHPFIFSLATVIPMPPDEVLRKGSGTLCEQLLMVQAFQKHIVCPNKHVSASETMYKGHLLSSETYIGGKVEALESGVFRADLPVRFKCVPSAYQGLLDNLDRDLGYAITVEHKASLEDVENYEEVKAAIAERLTALRDTPNREEVPLIYHLDVAAMYPNIILTNRLQPSAIVSDEHCAACDFNRPGKTCLRPMEWVWRGETYSCSRAEYVHIKRQLQSESFPPAANSKDGDQASGPRVWATLAPEEQQKLLEARLKKYCQKVYKRVLDKPVVEPRMAGVCQRENSFYVDTVRAFRDRRYEYKGLNKTWKGKLEAAKASNDALGAAAAADMVVLYDSLQLAHKCILNSFYGYVMRKGARWYSMEMAGVVTNTGANIIQSANKLVTQLGKPLELDTDGIWCALPGSFPEDFAFKSKKGKALRISYPCVMLNVLVAEGNTNDQYATLVDPEKKLYKTSSEMSIEFEVDGPYRAMILPASKEEGKLIKKRYAVFNLDGSLAELKGFEMKRRGELKLIKVFQAEVFEQFLAGSSLKECYDAVGAVANRWLDMLETQGTDLTDEELLDYISEATTMSKAMEDYDGRKSCAITTAKRLGMFLGDERMKDKGLNCQYVIARRPESQPTSERAIPVQIFSAEPSVARSWLRKWCGGDIGSAAVGEVPDVRDIVDWAYYTERLGSAIQKIITIPAAMQHVANPVPRVKHPDWLHKRVRERDSKSQQMRLDVMMAGQHAKAAANKAAKAAAALEAGDGAGEAAEAAQAAGAAASVAGVAGRAGAKRAAADMLDIEDMMAGPSKAHTGHAGKSARVTRRVTPGAEDDASDRDGSGGSSGSQEQDENAGDTANVAAGQRVAGEQARTSGRKEQRQQGKQGKQQRQEQQQQQDLGPKPDRRTDYKAWVAHQKQHWRQVRQERKRRKVEATKRPVAGAGDGRVPQQLAPTGNIGQHFRQQQALAANSHWQLLRLAPTAEPGTFKAWVLVDSALYGVMVRVPRSVYLNATVSPGDPAAEALGKSVRGLLPHGDKVQHLYKLTMSEPAWRASINTLSAHLLSSGVVLGAYETRLPLELHAALSLGCVVRVAPTAKSRALGEVYELKELQMKSTTQCTYLEGPGPEGLGTLRYVALFHSADTVRGRAVYTLLMPAAARCVVAVVVPSGIGANQREVGPALLERSWRECGDVLSAQGYNTQEQIAALSKVQFAVEYCSSALDAAVTIQRSLQGFRESHRGPVLVAAQSPQGWARLANDIPLLGELPCVDVPVLGEDSRYPALQWQQRAARRAIQRVATIGGWLRERAALCRYAHMPLADLGGDPSIAIADALFARNLRSAGHLLWVENASLPDLGVEPMPEDFFLLPQPPEAELAVPGCYRSVCVELKLHHLAVCALHKAADIVEMEGGSSMDSVGAPAFKVLRNLVQAWLADAMDNNNPIADRLLQNLYRWLSNPASKLFDPQLQEGLCRLMQKLFVALVSDLKRLGATLVAGTFGSVILCTGKRNLSAAIGYVRFLLTTLGRKELFELLEVTPTRWWHVLHYRDTYNWGGVEACVSAERWQASAAGPSASAPSVNGGAASESEVGGSMDAEEEDNLEIGTPNGPKLSCQWNLVQFLPPLLHSHLTIALAEFSYKPWKEAAQAVARGATQGGSQAVNDAINAEKMQLDYLKEQMLGGPWAERLMSKVEAIMQQVPAGSSHEGCHFPQLAGSHLTEEEQGTPALAFVKTLTHLLSLDSALTHETTLLRRRLLKLLRVTEFGAASQFEEPCISIRMRDVICSHCNDCRDLDLCRDVELQQHQWRCQACQQPYDQPAIEARQIDMLQGRIKEFVLQDLRCVKCHNISEAHLHGQCEVCGGALANTIAPRDFRKRLTVFRNCGRYHGFQLVQELADTMLADGRLPGAGQ